MIQTLCDQCQEKYPPEYRTARTRSYQVMRKPCANKGNSRTPCKSERGMASHAEFNYCRRCAEVYRLCQVCGRHLA